MTYTFLKLNASNSDTDYLAAQSTEICRFLKLEDDQVCEGHVNSAKDAIAYILRNSSDVTPNNICSVAFQVEYCNEDDHLADAFPVIVDTLAAPVASKRATPVSPNDGQLTVLHLSDFHYDPLYATGSNAECKEGICCRGDQGFPADPKKAAGFWGDYRFCDSPWRTVQDLIAAVKTQYPKIDVIYFTGDIVHHFYWTLTIDGNTDVIRQLTRLLKEEFPGIQLYPVLGNHEGVPANS